MLPVGYLCTLPSSRQVHVFRLMPSTSGATVSVSGVQSAGGWFVQHLCLWSSSLNLHFLKLGLPGVAF